MVGAPRANDLVGKVSIFDETLDINTMYDIPGEQMGGYFGHSVAVDDLNGDG